MRLVAEVHEGSGQCQRDRHRRGRCLYQVACLHVPHPRSVGAAAPTGQGPNALPCRAFLAMTAPFGPTMTASSGSTRTIADGLSWPGFRQSTRRKTSSWVVPVQAVTAIPGKEGWGQLKASVGPGGSFLTTFLTGTTGPPRQRTVQCQTGELPSSTRVYESGNVLSPVATAVLPPHQPQPPPAPPWPTPAAGRGASADRSRGRRPWPSGPGPKNAEDKDRWHCSGIPILRMPRAVDRPDLRASDRENPANANATELGGYLKPSRRLPA